jgi:hypothetical protein
VITSRHAPIDIVNYFSCETILLYNSSTLFSSGFIITFSVARSLNTSCNMILAYLPLLEKGSRTWQSRFAKPATATMRNHSALPRNSTGFSKKWNVTAENGLTQKRGQFFGG